MLQKGKYLLLEKNRRNQWTSCFLWCLSGTDLQLQVYIRKSKSVFLCSEDHFQNLFNYFNQIRFFANIVNAFDILLQVHYLRKMLYLLKDKNEDEEILHSLGCSWTARKSHIKIKGNKSYTFKENTD